MKSINKEQLVAYNKDYDSNVCNRILQNALLNNEMFSSIKKFDEIKKTHHSYKLDIKTMKATNQQSSGRCWIFAGLNVLREIVGKKCNIEEVELSQNYIAFYDKFEKINYLMEKIIEFKDSDPDDRTLSHLLSIGVQDGGQWDMFVNIVKKYGIVPQCAFGETYQSNHTANLNFVINTTMKKFCSFVHKNTDNMDIIKEEKEKLLQKLYNLLCVSYGKPIEDFDFEYVDKDNKYHLEQCLTPMTFYKNYVGEILDDYVSVINAPTPSKPFNRLYTVKHVGNVVEGNNIKYLNVTMDRMRQMCLRQLIDNELVWFGSDCGKYSDRVTGIWNDKAYDFINCFGLDLDMPKGDMLDYHFAAMNHAMVITGSSFKNSKVVKWKIENSWGTDKANNGYYLMTDTWYERFVFQAVINKKHLIKEELEALKTEPIELEPWDPMGTLAD